jgi:MGT family glycosyltransferase
MIDASAVEPRRFLFVLWDGGGNVPPQLAIARRLVDRGHKVRILAPRVLEQRIKAAGCVFVPYTRAPEHNSASPEHDILQDWEPRTPLGAAARVRDRLMAEPALAFARDVLDALEMEPADIVVVDCLLLGAYIGAERAGVPTAALFHQIYPLPDPAIPPFGLGFQPANGAPGRLRDALFRRIFARFYGAALSPVNDARRQLGLAPLSSIFEIFNQPDKVLILSSRAFDFPAAALPENVRYVGAQLEDSVPKTAWESPWAPDDQRPLIVVSASTTYQQQRDLLQRVIDALKGMPVRALVTVGPALDTDSLSQHANVVLRSYVPHQQVVPQADLVITHGGHGTVMMALSNGVPVLCLPMGRDQADVAARAVWRGAGLSMSSRSKPDAIRRTVMRMLAEPRFRVGARRVATEMACADGESSIVEELEALYDPERSARLLVEAR